MKTAEQKQNQEVTVQESLFATIGAANCFQIRESLDSLFDGASTLEATPVEIRRILFAHLEFCGTCCRSFDVRVRLRAIRRDTIY